MYFHFGCQCIQTQNFVSELATLIYLCSFDDAEICRYSDFKTDKAIVDILEDV